MYCSCYQIASDIWIYERGHHWNDTSLHTLKTRENVSHKTLPRDVLKISGNFHENKWDRVHVSNVAEL